MKKYLRLLVLVLAMVLVLAACSPKNDANNSNSSDNNNSSTTSSNEASNDNESSDSESLIGNFVDSVEHEGTPLPDGEGVFKVGLVSSSPFKGIFSSILYSGNDDSNIMQYTMWGTFATDGEFRVRKGGPAYVEFDKDNKTMTIKINDKYTWNDGTPVTAQDFKYAYEVIGHADYPGPRYGEDYENVVGMEEYHWGTMSEEKRQQLRDAAGDAWEEPTFEPATEISGIEVIDDKTLKITLKEFGVGMLWGEGLVNEPVPYHQWKDIPIDKLMESDAVRKNPLSPGPYYISSLVPGESVELTANPYYWKGTPHIGKVLMKVIDPDKLVASMEAGEYDHYTYLPSSKYQDVKDLDNYTLLGRVSMSYGYMGFKMGKWNPDKNENEYDPNSKMANLNLRKALAHAIDYPGISETYLNGLSYQGTTVIGEPFTAIHDSSIKPLEFDMDLAKKLLDDAGYVDKDGDGFREDPKGNPFELNVAVMKGNDVSEKIATYYLQQWNELGLKAQFTNGRTLEFNNFYDLVQADDPNIDVFFGAWSLGTNPDCSSLYGRNVAWNFSRFASEELDKLLADLSSEAAFDDEYRKEAYRKVQKYIFDEMPVYVTLYRYDIQPINKRVKSYSIKYDDGKDPVDSWADLQLTAPEPIRKK